MRGERLDGNGEDQMRGEERAGSVRPFSTRTEFTVECRDDQRDKRAMGYHRQVLARSGCMDIDGSAK